jgi:hypothetical protein
MIIEIIEANSKGQNMKKNLLIASTAMFLTLSFAPQAFAEETPPPAKPAGDKPAKPAGEKPAGEKPAKPAGEKPAKPAGEKPTKPAGEKPAGEKPAKPAGEKPLGFVTGG